jgi:hypothetical protein
MNVLNQTKYAVVAVAAAATLAGCNAGMLQQAQGGAAQTGAGGAIRPTEAQVRAAFMKTNAAGFVPAFHHNRLAGREHLSMLPLKKGAKTTLIYVSDAEEGAVELFDYPSGTYLGETTGLEYPYGMCSDKDGNAYVVDFDNQDISEIAEGTLNVIKTAKLSSGYPIGCAVNPKTGDLAVTLFEGGAEGYGSVEILKGGISGSPTAYTYTDYTWPAGYDSKGDLYAEGEDGSCDDCIWTLQAGSSTPQEVTWSGGSIEFPGAIELDGNQVLIGQQEVNDEYESGFYPTTCSGTTCTSSSPIVLSDNCYNTYVDIVQWAEDSKKPNLQSKGKVKGNYAFAAGNLWCEDEEGYTGISEWSIKGGDPTGGFGPPPYEADGQTIVN